MKKLSPILLCLLFIFCGTISAQNTFKAVIKSGDEDAAPLNGANANVVGTQIGAMADSNGLVVLENIPDGEQNIEFSYLGFFKKRIKVKFPQAANTPATEVQLQSQAQQVEDVVVTSTRNYQKPEYLPTRVEVVGEDEVEERSHDKPSDVSHVVREQPGVQVQRTSATAGTMSIRLQGLSSRYVQVLKDGFPLFGGFSNVIGITQIPPLDLKQVEIIKGPSSTLYGGDAMSGVIDLVTKEPTTKPVYDLLFNGESSVAFDGGAYASQKFKWFAFSLTGIYRYQKAKDWDGDNFTETPQLQRYNISPQLYFDLSKKAKLNVGASYTKEDRLSGAIPYIEGRTDSVYNYYEKNKSQHVSTNFRFDYDFGDAGKLTVKNAINLFQRDLRWPYYYFAGSQVATTSEINYRFIKKKHDVVLGIDLRTDQFTEGRDSVDTARNYKFITFGFFAQYLYHLDPKTTFELGLRLDYNNVHKFFPLPHAAILRRWSDIFSTRLNFGMGYKLPTIFQDEAEEARFINVAAIAPSVKPEISLGGTLDLSIKLPNFNGFHMNINQLYFITNIMRPLLSDTATKPGCTTGDCEQLSFINGNGHIQSIGVETGLNMSYRGISASLVYTLTDNHRKIDGVFSISPLTSKHIISILVGYEIKNFFIGLDCYYYSPVKLSDGSVGKRIWEIGLNTLYAFKYFILFANFENIADIRQTSYSRVVFPNPTFAHPAFAEIYAPLEGRLFNAGFKLRLGAFSKKKVSDDGVERLRRKDND